TRSDNWKLSELKLSGGVLTPEFSEAIMEYEALIAPDVATIQLTIRAAHRQATISVNGQQVQGEQGRIEIPIDENLKTIDIVVTAEDGTRKTYSIVVEREQEELPVDSPPTVPVLSDSAGHWAELSIQEALTRGS